MRESLEATAVTIAATGTALRSAELAQVVRPAAAGAPCASRRVDRGYLKGTYAPLERWIALLPYYC